jgi:hypothetical protein
VLLWGQAGDETVRLRHLKQPVAVVGPWTVSIDHATGSVSRDIERENKLGDAIASFLAVSLPSTSSEIAPNVGKSRRAVEDVLDADERFVRVEPPEERRKSAKTWTLAELVPDSQTSSDKNGRQPALACSSHAAPMGAGGTSKPDVVRADETGPASSRGPHRSAGSPRSRRY